MTDWPAADPGIAEARRLQGRHVCEQTIREVIDNWVPVFRSRAVADELNTELVPVLVDELHTRLVMTVRDEPEVIRDEC